MLKFPVVIIKKRESPLYVFDFSQFGLISKGGANFYKKGTICDSEGKVYALNGISDIKKTPFLISLKYFQQMYKVAPNYIFEETVSLSDFKKIITAHINMFNGYWIKRDLIKNLETSINSLNSFSEIIEFVK